MEVYSNAFTVTLSANYVAGSGTLAVSGPAPARVQNGTFRVRLANTVNSIQNTILIVSAGAAGTNWTVVAEANDASAPAGTTVYGCEVTAGMLDALFAQYTGGSLPSSSTGSSPFAIPLVAPPDPATLTWVNGSGATATKQANGFLFRAPAQSSGTDSIACLVKPIPANPYNFTVSGVIDFFPSQYALGGVVVYDSGSGKLITFGPAIVGARLLSVDYWNNYSSHNSSPSGSLSFDWRAPLLLRVSDDGVNLSFSMSSTGLDFSVVLASAGRTSFLNPTHLGVFLDANNGHPATLYVNHWDGV